MHPCLQHYACYCSYHYSISTFIYTRFRTCTCRLQQRTSVQAAAKKLKGVESCRSGRPVYTLECEHSRAAHVQARQGRRGGTLKHTSIAECESDRCVSQWVAQALPLNLHRWRVAQARPPMIRPPAQALRTVWPTCKHAATDAYL